MTYQYTIINRGGKNIPILLQYLLGMCKVIYEIVQSIIRVYKHSVT